MLRTHLITAMLLAVIAHSSCLRSEDASAASPIAPMQPIFPQTLSPSATVEELEHAYTDQPQPESVRMLLAILKGSKMGYGEGWFSESQSAYSWEWLLESQGLKDVKSIPAETFQGDKALFDRLDRDKNGHISEGDLDWSEDNNWVRHAYLCNRLFRKIDPSGDGQLTREEWLAFFDKVAGERTAVTSDDMRDAWLAGMTGSFLPGDAPTKELLVQGFFAGDLGSMQEGPSLGSLAPDFTLTTVDGQQTIHLAEVIGKKPVVLCFGNFTCGPFRSMYPDVEKVRARFAEDAVFLAVYVREAHPTDGWRMPSNERVGVQVSQPKTLGERIAVATQCSAMLKPQMPLLVDDATDTVGHAYSGMPARLYVINTKGEVTYKGGRGPFGFKAGEMEQALIMTLLDQKATAARAAINKPAPLAPRVELVSDIAAWEKLPEAKVGHSHALPNWAKALAPTLPHTVAAMLELDHLYRTTPQFTQRERGLIRHAVATVNHSDYGLAYAHADLAAAGLTRSELDALNSGTTAALTDPEQRLVAYARQASLAARDLTDEQVETLQKELGDDRLVGLVLLTAYANFQDRLVLALSLPIEVGGPVAPLPVQFAATASTPGGSLVPQAERPAIPSASDSLEVEHPTWTDFAFDSLQTRLEHQRARAPRVTIPSWEELKDRLPKGLYNPRRPLEIRWSRLVMCRQPELGPAWIKCLRVFGNEAKQNRAFEESVFWVVTRDLRCFYCMGHCEMLMEVGGLSKDQIADRTRKMADGDWRDFTPAERATFSLASEMTRTPWSISDADIAMANIALGPERTLDAIWWIARCQFMTKVSDTFQLQLERENVFQHFEPPQESSVKSAAAQ